MRTWRDRWRLIALAVAVVVTLVAVVLGSGSDPVTTVSPVPDDVAATIVTNATVWTVDQDLPTADAFAFASDGVIIRLASHSNGGPCSTNISPM